MELAPRHVRELCNLSRMLSVHGKGDRPCLLCDEELHGEFAAEAHYGGAPREID